MTPLHFAAKYGHLKIVEMLIQSGADKNCMAKSCRTPLHLASIEGRFETAKILLQNKVDINCMDSDFKTPLHYSVEKRHLEFVEMLLLNEANVNCQSRTKLTPLLFASRYGFTEIVKLLIQNKANVNITDSDNDTSLHLACEYGHKKVVENILLAKNIHLTLKNRDGKTALEIAKEKNDINMYRMVYERMVELFSLKKNQNENVEEYQEIKSLIFDKFEGDFSQKVCVVCYDPRNGTFVLLPCGHAKTCETCSDRLVKESKHCPMCRSIVTKYQKIFD